jgi:hypothetical protein
VTPRASAPVVLRGGVVIEDPLAPILEVADRWWVQFVGDRSASFGEPDLRLANRGGARISAAQIAVLLQRRPEIEAALAAIAPDASLARAARAVPWRPLGQLFEAFADVSGVGFAKLTKTLHPKRPALIPMLDSVVQAYLQDDDPGVGAPFSERALALVRGYKGDLDANRAALRAVRRELARRGYDLGEVRILDVLIWSAGRPDLLDGPPNAP